MTSSERGASAAAHAAALGAKTARGCDSCLRRRARWYCAADDAFLCQSCDSSVHSANPLAGRHKRARLNPTSSSPKASSVEAAGGESLPSWLQGFRRKARSPRGAKPGSALSRHCPAVLVPDVTADDISNDDTQAAEAQLLYRVPVFDPVVPEFRSASSDPPPGDSKPTISDLTDPLPGFLPSDIDLAEFADDVESLLGRGVDGDAFCMEELGLLEPRNDDGECCRDDRERVKAEIDDGEAPTLCLLAADFDLCGDMLEMNFHCYSPTTGEEEEEEKLTIPAKCADTDERKKIFLRLDYKAVIAAWASQGSPWTTGDGPLLHLEDSWLDSLADSSSELHPHAAVGGMGPHVAAGEGGREARVSRYREKRRTRLFSKKIRYEVRKLNAEKRPRMKGRFVKRAASTSPPLAF